MLLEDIFDHLTYGELFQLSIGGAEVDGFIAIDDYPKIIPHINLGLLELFKRFPLHTKSIEILQDNTINKYLLKSEYSLNSGSAQPIKYLLDSVNDVFTDTVLKIEEVFDVDGKNIPLNDRNNEDSYYTPTYNSLLVPAPNDTTTVKVTYRAAHNKIVVAGLDPTTTEVEIPASLLEPLLYFVASRVQASVLSMDGQNESLMHLQKFEASIAKIKELDLINDDEFISSRVIDNGWV